MRHNTMFFMVRATPNPSARLDSIATPTYHPSHGAIGMRSLSR
jgi:hypothetical protein